VAQAKAIAGYCTTKEAIAGLTMPSLVLHGDEDRAVPFIWGEELAATLPNSRFVKFAGAGHNFLVADREKSAAEVLAFLETVDRLPRAACASM
jgi:pimeloyl-ACP methyl ester carboxylesterase